MEDYRRFLETFGSCETTHTFRPAPTRPTGTIRILRSPRALPNPLLGRELRDRICGYRRLLTVKAHLTSGAYQTTQFVYGVTGSVINSNDLLAEMRYPDKSSGNPSTTENEDYTYNALGERVTKEDRNGNIHMYSFDVVGRPTSDAVTQIGTGVDGAVRRLEPLTTPAVALSCSPATTRRPAATSSTRCSASSTAWARLPRNIRPTAAR
jgi:hypothetical protein